MAKQLAHDPDDLDDDGDLPDAGVVTDPQNSLVRYREPQKGLSPPNPVNPATLGFPPMLPIELAMRTAPVPDICAAYNITRTELIDLTANPVFAAAFKRAQELVEQEGMSFKLKAQMQAEALLIKAWEMVHNTACPFNVRADMIKSVVRWAGYEKKDAAGGGGGAAFNIQINL